MSNVFVIHGVDHKVGTTMITQSIAEIISRALPDKKVLLLFLNGRRSTEFIGEKTGSMENLKLRIDNMMIDGSEINSFCLIKGNLFILAGISKMEEERLYFPENAIYLLKEISKQFDLIIVDSGNDLDNGLAIGALKYTENRILILTQQETALRRYEELATTYVTLGFAFQRFIINKYYLDDPYDNKYIMSRIGVEKEAISFISQHNNYRQAEVSYKSLLEFKDENYSKDIINVSNHMLEKIGLDKIQNTRRNRKWINFI